MRSKISEFLKPFASDKLTIVLLALLIVLTVLGTVQQRNIGLYQAKKEYFESVLFFWKWGQIAGYPIGIPFPGALSVLAIFFINLVAALVVKFKWNLKSLGPLLCHGGVVVLMIGSFFAFLYSREGYISLSPGESTSEFVSSGTHRLLVVDTTSPDVDQIVAFPQKFLKKAKILKWDSLPFQIEIKEYYENCKVYKNSKRENIRIEPLKADLDNEENVPGYVLKVFTPNKVLAEIILDPGSSISIPCDDKRYIFELAKQKIDMRFSIHLISASREDYPGTKTPRHFESKINVSEGDIIENREVIISMNRPFRYKGYTFYQHKLERTFDVPWGKPVSTLAVVKNPAASWPYISCLLIAMGMIIHFFQKLLAFLQRKTKVL